MIQEFKKFMIRGNVMDLAVGVIIGAAFTKIVTSLVNDIITPLLSIIIGKMDFSDLVIELGTTKINIGIFFTNIIDFLLTGIAVFLLVKALNKLNFKKQTEKKTEDEATTKHCPFCTSSIPIKAVRCPECTSDLTKES